MERQKYDFVYAWQRDFNRSQVSLWILLSLQDDPKSYQDIALFMTLQTSCLALPKQMSLYRALRRLAKAGLIAVTTRNNPDGRDFNDYSLTALGRTTLAELLRRIGPTLRNMLMLSQNMLVLISN